MPSQMRISLVAVVALAFLVFGCSTHPAVLNPKVTEALQNGDLDLLVEKVNAYTYWNSSYGHGMDVEVWVARDPNDYSRDLQLELEGASKVYAALAMSDFSIRFDFLEVRFFIVYGKMPPGERNVHGVVDVIIERNTLVKLRERGAEAAEYTQNWVLVNGFKDQPDSKELLEW